MYFVAKFTMTETKFLALSDVSEKMILTTSAPWQDRVWSIYDWFTTYKCVDIRRYRMTLGYLLDIGDIQCSVDEPAVHGMFSVFAFLVQVHCL